jgi:hypothetical protein
MQKIHHTCSADVSLGCSEELGTPQALRVPSNSAAATSALRVDLKGWEVMGAASGVETQGTPTCGAL